jgi:hypothetical protein
MKKHLPLILLLIGMQASAQVPEDAIRYSFFPQGGTARTQAIGGVMASLGGDISATFINPAGLGNYKTGEVVITPGWFINNNKIDYRGTNEKSGRQQFGLGPIGIVFGQANRFNPKKHSNAFSFAFTQMASFNNRMVYNGFNNMSSFGEQWAEEISNSGKDFDQILDERQYAFGSAQAVFTYLVDTFRNGNNLQLKTMPEFVLAEGKALRQQKISDSRGGLYELALGFASNKEDKWLLGGSIGIPILNYRNTTTYIESDTSSNFDNNFNYLEFNDNFSTTGVGINARVGIIYRPQEHIRFGAALHTPSYMFYMKDKRNNSLEVDTENYNGLANSNSGMFTVNGAPGENKYTMLMPWRFIVSGSYVFRELEDVRKQRAFISADIEYVRHRSSRFYSADEETGDEEQLYFNALNDVVKDQYKGSFNFKLGGEIKFNTIMARAGVAYYTNPYRDKALKANRFLLSGGLGYRHKGFFIDLTYVHAFNKDVDFGYRLQDKANTFATVKNQRGNIVGTLGIKF